MDFFLYANEHKTNFNLCFTYITESLKKKMIFFSLFFSFHIFCLIIIYIILFLMLDIVFCEMKNWCELFFCGLVMDLLTKSRTTFWFLLRSVCVLFIKICIHLQLAKDLKALMDIIVMHYFESVMILTAHISWFFFLQ